MRELRNTIERLVIMTPGERIEARHLPATVAAGAAPAEPGPSAPAPVAGEFPSLLDAREDFEKRYIWKKYQECGGNMSRTSEALQVERSNLYRKMKGYGLLPSRKGEAVEQGPGRQDGTGSWTDCRGRGLAASINKEATQW